MKKTWLIILAITLTISLVSFSEDWKELDLGVFKISIPKEWNYDKAQGIDSFIGDITTPNSQLNFDYSTLGDASSLVPTESEYLKNEEWLRDCPLYKSGITYTASFNVKNEKAKQMKEKGITDSSLVKVEADPCFMAKKYIHKPTAEQKSKFPLSDYIAELVYKGDTTILPIQIPLGIKNLHIQIDTTEKFITKTIWPKVAGKGVIGIYIRSRISKFSFVLVGENLSPQDQELALKAFKTIRFKE